jgi:hypothetical protein
MVEVNQEQSLPEVAAADAVAPVGSRAVAAYERGELCVRFIASEINAPT